MDDVVTVQGLRKAYGGVEAVRGISFTVHRGEIFGLLGPNGAGKTTTVECVQGLRRADSGTIRVLGLDPADDFAALRRRVGSQLQESALPDRIRVWEALRLFASFGERDRGWQSLLREWDLTALRDAFFGRLSGGQRQRLLVALALVNDPEVVFLDEMTSGLDPAARRVAWSLIRQVRDRGTTTVLVTHFMDEAEHLCDRVAVIDHGLIVALDTPQALINAVAPSIRLRFSFEDADVGWLGNLPHVSAVRVHDHTCEVEGRGPVLTEVAAALGAHAIPAADLRVEQPTLEDAFLLLTGSEVRE